MLFLISTKIVRDLFKIYFSILFLSYTCDWVICIMNLTITMKKKDDRFFAKFFDRVV